jgi:serine/threonine-protein kinase
MMGRVFMGRYETIRLLGEGGMGRVYLARQLDLGREVVIKVMHDHIAADAKFRERFQRETLLMARFVHPYAVTLFDARLEDAEGPCIVMEYIKGVPLDTLLLGNRRLTPQRAGRLLRQLCEVLQAAHAAGIVHRDLKPANLMIVDPGTGYEMLKVMDFGLAKLVDPAGVCQVTNAEFAVGTPGYMCPEQARGEQMDHRGDLYSVGIILYEMLTGRLPFTGESTMEVLLAHATEPPPRFSQIGAAAGVAPAIEEVVMVCLAKEPSQRPSSARELADRFDTALAAEQSVAPDPLALPRRAATTMIPGPRPSPLPAPASSVLGSGTSPSSQTPVFDPLATIHHIEAWMPERIAAYKLSGFIQDVGGELLVNEPGKILVRLGGKNCTYLAPVPRSFSWFGLGRRSSHIDMELRLQRGDSGRDNQLFITVLLKPAIPELSTEPSWRKLATQIFCDLRGYLMGQNGTVTTEASS